MAGLISYRQMLYGFDFDKGFQFVNGSFVEDVETTGPREPGDIDVLSFLQKPDRYFSDPALWVSEGLPRWTGEIADQAKNKGRFNVDSYALAADDSMMSLIRATMYWYGLFSHQRVTMRWKGFLAIPLNPADDAAASRLL